MVGVVMQLPHLHHLYTPVPDKHSISGVDVLEDGLGFKAWRVWCGAGAGGGARHKAAASSLVCKGWNIQSVGAPGARTPSSTHCPPSGKCNLPNPF